MLHHFRDRPAIRRWLEIPLRLRQPRCRGDHPILGLLQIRQRPLLVGRCSIVLRSRRRADRQHPHQRQTTHPCFSHAHFLSCDSSRNSLRRPLAKPSLLIRRHPSAGVSNPRFLAMYHCYPLGTRSNRVAHPFRGEAFLQPRPDRSPERHQPYRLYNATRKNLFHRQALLATLPISTKQSSKKEPHAPPCSVLYCSCA
jgi:hypothetical protein